VGSTRRNRLLSRSRAATIHTHADFLSATYCKTLQLSATHYNTLHHIAPHCHTLKHTAGRTKRHRLLSRSRATMIRTHTVVRSGTAAEGRGTCARSSATWPRVERLRGKACADTCSRNAGTFLLCVAVCCSVLPCAGVCYSVMCVFRCAAQWHVAREAKRNRLRQTAIHYYTLQHTAVCCSNIVL